MDSRERYWLKHLGVEGLPEEVSFEPQWLENRAFEAEDADEAHCPEVLNVPDEERAAFDDESRALYPDPRWSALRGELQGLIYRRFGGDVDEAMLHADKVCHAYNRPPAWALELHAIHMRLIGRTCTCHAFDPEIPS